MNLSLIFTARAIGLQMVPFQHHQRLQWYLHQELESILVLQSHHGSDWAGEVREPRCCFRSDVKKLPKVAENLRTSCGSAEIQRTRFDDWQLPDLRTLHASFELKSAADAKRRWRFAVAWRIWKAKWDPATDTNEVSVDLREYLEVHSRRRSCAIQAFVGKGCDGRLENRSTEIFVN